MKISIIRPHNPGLLAMMLAIIMTCALMAGCGDAKLTTQTVQGTKTAIQIDLPFTLENQLKEEQIPQMAYIQSLSELRFPLAISFPAMPGKVLRGVRTVSVRFWHISVQSSSLGRRQPSGQAVIAWSQV